MALWSNVIEDVTIEECQEVARLACLKVNHCPDATSIAKWCAVSAMDGEVTVGEVPLDALHPCPDLAMFVLARHLIHLDAKSGEHPRVLRLVQGCDAPTTLLRMVAGRVEHVVAQDAEEDVSPEVDMKGLDVEGVGVY